MKKIIWIILFLTALAAVPPPAVANPAAPPEDGAIEAKVVAVNRNFGFFVVDKGAQHGVKAGMKVSILRDKKWVSGILKIGEIDEKATVLEYEKGKSDPRDAIKVVKFK